ncbi:MAG TPA: peptide deformylase [Stellaceae bacterium]|nr:peptide deformylase [Stellaceae bacterium]
MAILKIARMGHPVLRRKAEPVADPTAPEIRRLVADMVETLVDIGGAGLAAPQVHVPLRVVIFRVPEERVSGRPEDAPQALLTLINPVVEPMGEARELGWEGCLSVPGLRGAVPRFARIRYQGATPEGGSVLRIVEGFHARVVQHECDHLDGILYPQRMTDLSLLVFNEEGARYPLDLGAAAPATA